jgi:hypothetical protein
MRRSRTPTASTRDRLLQDVVDEAEAFAEQEYPALLAAGLRLDPAQKQEAAARIGALIGVDPEWVERADLRVEHMAFLAELLREEGLVTGRIDGRFTAPAGDGNSARMETDPSIDQLAPSYTATINQYLGGELEFSADVVYEIMSGRVHPWSYKDFENRSVEVATDLARVLRKSPHTRVLVSHGYHDAATPFHASEHVLAQLAIPREDYSERIRVEYYEAGHMMYCHEPSRLELSQHLREFVAGDEVAGDRRRRGPRPSTAPERRRDQPICSDARALIRPALAPPSCDSLDEPEDPLLPDPLPLDPEDPDEPDRWSRNRCRRSPVPDPSAPRPAGRRPGRSRPRRCPGPARRSPVPSVLVPSAPVPRSQSRRSVRAGPVLLLPVRAVLLLGAVLGRGAGVTARGDGVGAGDGALDLAGARGQLGAGDPLDPEHRGHADQADHEAHQGDLHQPPAPGGRGRLGGIGRLDRRPPPRYRRRPPCGSARSARTRPGPGPGHAPRPSPRPA